jgi:hypothetical protein
MDRPSRRKPPAERLEGLKRRLEELARQLGSPAPGQRVRVPIPIDRRPGR